MRALNAEWRGKDKPTNVLSFPMAEAHELSTRAMTAGQNCCSATSCSRAVSARAKRRRKAIAVEDHATHLIVHGTLHLLGYDHQGRRRGRGHGGARGARAAPRSASPTLTTVRGLMADARRRQQAAATCGAACAHLIFGDDSEPTLRDEIEEAIDEAEDDAPVAGDLSPAERQMLRNLLHFGEQHRRRHRVTRGDIIAVPETISFDDLVARLRRGRPQPPAGLWRQPR